MAHDAAQRLLAVGTAEGVVELLGSAEQGMSRASPKALAVVCCNKKYYTLYMAPQYTAGKRQHERRP